MSWWQRSAASLPQQTEDDDDGTTTATSTATQLSNVMLMDDGDGDRDCRHHHQEEEEEETPSVMTKTTLEPGGGRCTAKKACCDTADMPVHGGVTSQFSEVVGPPASWVRRVERGEEFVCGWGAAFINITCTFPMNKIIFRQQLLGIHGKKALAQLRNEGLRHLYRGFLPPLLLKTTTMSIMFGSYTTFQTTLDASFPPPTTTAPTSTATTQHNNHHRLHRQLNHAAAAMLAGMLETALTPFERIQTLLQDRTYHARFQNTLHATVQLRAYGFREFYRGWTAILLRNGPSNVFFFLGREHVNEAFSIGAVEQGPGRVARDFLCGAVLGALISTGFFPVNVLKTRMQSQLGTPYLGLRQAFEEVWVERNRSVSGLFRGFHINYMRSFISWGIINASYEYLMQLFRQFGHGHPSSSS